ncbi:MAG: phospho-sugar mutase [Oscillospiraceae bacterium]|nr:phospho-sugar mutase [Oscillospiraceae bacterium]
MTAMEKYELWCREVPADSPVGQELTALKGDSAEIQARFGGDLSFGTAGLRGVMGAGTDRMNVYTVRRAALAYGQYIKAAPLPDTCVIAYDTRNNGLLFSQTCAVALAEEGIQVYLFREPTPTPVLSFAVRHLSTGGGVVMTASHNPAPYNGMKCYGNDGCQQTDEPAAEVYARIQKLPMISHGEKSFEDYVAEGRIQLIWDEVYDAYYEAVLGEMLCKDLIPVSGLKILYTPLHGTGLVPVTTLFDRLGVDYDVVTAQATPDGDFPTCPYPNPETEPAFDEAKKVIAEGGKYDLIVATDPDADRVAVAVPMADGSIQRLSGNELGCMLLEFILNNRTRQGTLPANSKCIKSIVTTPMVLNVAKKYGCENIDVLTGFKYIGSTILGLEQQGRENEVVFAFEESCGFLKGTYARDKDAQVACVLVCALAAACKLDGLTVADKLRLLYQNYGFYKTRVVSVELDGEKGKKLCAEFIDSLRANTPADIAGMAVGSVADYKLGIEKDLTTGEEKKLDFPSSNVLSFQVGASSRVILRPSGTEPKLKIYYFAAHEEEERALEILSGLVSAMNRKMQDFGISC